MRIEPIRLTVNEIIDRQPVRPFQIWIIVLCGIVLILDGFDAQTIGFLAPSVSQSLHIPLNAFGPIFSSSLVGLMIAAMAAGPIADRWGRKWPVISSTLMFAVFSILTAHVASFNQLLLFRFLTGVGLGGAMPNVVAIASEYSPRRLLPLFVAALFAGMPLGGFICGTASSLLIPTLGWRSVFYLGGILPLVIAVLSIKSLPESARFLNARGVGGSEIARIMAKISPELANASIAPPRPDISHKGVTVKHLFTEGRAVGTILLWIPFFMNLLILYVVVNWLPALLRESGMSVANGVTATALFSLGGIVGSLAEGPLMTAIAASWLLAAEFGLCAVLIGALGFLTSSFLLIATVAFFLGLFVTAAQAGINVLAASFYPTAIRSTGLGWALGVGRIGSIVGPLLAGMMLSSFGWRPRQLLIAGAVPALIAALTVLLSRYVGGTVDAYRPEADLAGVA